MTKYKIPVFKPKRLPALAAELRETGETNVYVRRKLAKPISVVDAFRLRMLANQQDESEAMGAMWRMERTMAHMLPIVTHMLTTIRRLKDEVSVSAQVFGEDDPV